MRVFDISSRCREPKVFRHIPQIGAVRPGTVWIGAEEEVNSTSIAMERKLEPALLFMS
jgi:hypothetical protein